MRCLVTYRCKIRILIFWPPTGSSMTISIWPSAHVATRSISIAQILVRECPVAKTFADGRSHQAEMVVTSKSGKRYNVLITTAPLQNSAGEIHQVMEMSTNITQIQRAPGQPLFAGAQNQLRFPTASKSLLTGLDGSIYLVDTGLAKDDPRTGQGGVGRRQDNCRRIRKLVFDILYFAKERELDLESVNVLHFAQDVAASFEPKIGARSVVFEYNFDAAAGNCRIDAGMLRIALFNLLENALDACAEHRSKRKSRIAFTVRQHPGRMIFEVADNGVGMDSGTIDNLFTLFFSSKGEKGTGMGLFIADKIVRQHGGMITVDSKPGQGSTFHVSIPMPPPHTADRQQV